MCFKKYVNVTARFDEDGNITPLAVILDNDLKFDVDRVLDVRPAASLKAGGAGIRYTCKICGYEKYLFLEENRWFVELKEKQYIAY